jgi:hypothetical protein
MDTRSIASPATAPALPPWRGDQLNFAALPATGDDGFPQVFLMELQRIVYRLTLTVFYFDPDIVLDSAYANIIFDLPDPAHGLSLNLKVEYEEQPAATRLIGAQRVVLDMPIFIGPLCFRFKRIRVARANLVGPGPFGSELVAEVAVNNG